MTNHPLRKGRALLLAGIFLAAATGTALSATYTIRAGVDNLVMPDNAVIPVWGYAPVSGFPVGTTTSSGSRGLS